MTQSLDQFAPENLTRYLMLDMSDRLEFLWLSAKELHEKARAQSSALAMPLVGSPVSPDALRRSIKRLTERNPRALIFNSVMEAASPASTRCILAAPVPPDRSRAATAKLQQAMKYVLAHAGRIIHEHDWRMAGVMLHCAEIPGLDFCRAVALRTGKSGLTLESATDVYIEEIRGQGIDYLRFCNDAVAAHGVTLALARNAPFFGAHDAYSALTILVRNDFQVAMQNVLKQEDIQSSMKSAGAVASDVIGSPGERPLADIEKSMFKIGDNIFGAPIDGMLAKDIAHA